MKKLLTLLVLLFLATISPAQTNVITWGTDTVMSLSDQAYLSANERANIYQNRITTLTEDSLLPAIKLDSLWINNELVLFVDNRKILEITADDTLINELSQDSLYHKVSSILIKDLPTEVKLQNPRNVKKLLFQVLVFTGAIILCYLIFILFKSLGKWGNARIKKLVESGKLKTYSVKNVEVIKTDRQVKLLEIIIKVLRILLTIIFIYLTIPLAFSLFEETSHLAEDLFKFILIPISHLFSELFEFLPTLINVIVIIVILNYVLRFLKYLFDEIENEKLVVNGLRKEWAKPSFQIIKALAIILACVMILPMFPFSSSTLFLGFLAFIALVLLIGSVNLASNLVAGIQIMFLRPFNKGDTIKSETAQGKVIYSNLIITKIRNQNNELINIPNSKLLKEVSRNLSDHDGELGNIIRIPLKVSCNHSYKLVEKLLVEATLNSKGVIDNPKPVIIKDNIENNEINYIISAYYLDSEKKDVIKNNIYSRILDILEENNIKISD